ncbi:MAG: hypothetical protein EP321_09025 [Sphingomonadales bacterium]|nr:MAG: hypothetical protein EP321_09025 [Sphingomonadales bacterium]
MASDRLYIVGNGFDLHHGIASTYRHFAAWLAQVDHRIFRLVEEYFSADEEFWADFEQRLAEFDADQAVDYAMQFHSDERHGDFQYECEQIATGLSSGLRGCFAEWIRGLQIPVRGEIAQPIVIDPDALFFELQLHADAGVHLQRPARSDPAHPRLRRRPNGDAGPRAWVGATPGGKTQVQTCGAGR